MNYTMTKWCSPFTHVVPSQYEAWFEALASEGWHPQRIDHFSSIKMTFVKAKPKKYRYVVDLQPTPNREYRRTYEDFGWELVGQMSSMFVWRKEYQDVRPESFSDHESLQKRNKRFMLAISVCFAMFLIAAIGVTVIYPLTFSRLNAEQHVNCIVGIVFSYGFTIALGWVLKEIHKNRNT